MTRRAERVVILGILLLAPWGEGGRAPLALLLLHTLVLACAALAWVMPRPVPCRAAATFRSPWRIASGMAALGLLLALASALRASYPLAAALGSWDLIVPLLLFTATSRFDAEQRDRAWMRLAVLASTTLQSLMAAVRYSQGGPLAAGSSFLNPNHLAAFLNIGLFLALAEGVAALSAARRITWTGVAALHLVALVLLESRGAFLGFFAALIVLGVHHARSWTWRGRAAAIGVLFACALLALGSLGTRFSRAVDPYRFSRLKIWTAAGEMIAERPLFGFGPGMLPHIAQRFNFPDDVGPVRFDRGFQGAHSAYLTLAAETGIPAAALIVGALSILTLVFLTARAGADRTIFGVGLGLLALLAQGCVEDLQARPALLVVPAILAGAAVAAIRRDLTRSVPDVPAPMMDVAEGPGARSGRLVAAIAILYVFLLAVLLPWWADREAHIALSLGRSGLRHMEQAVVLNPLHPDYRNDIAMAILNSGPLTPSGYARAMAELLEARRLKSCDYRFPLHMARIESRYAPRLFDDAKGMDRAVPLYREAVRLVPFDPRPRLELAGHLVAMKREEEALPILREALALEPNFVRARILEASILLDSGHREEARASLRLAETALNRLQDYTADSSYAREITLDAQSERARLAATLEGNAPPSGPS